MEPVKTYGVKRTKFFWWPLAVAITFWIIIALFFIYNQNFNFSTFLLRDPGLPLTFLALLAMPFLWRSIKLEIGEDFITGRSVLSKFTIHAKDVSSVEYESWPIFGKGLLVTLAKYRMYFILGKYFFLDEESYGSEALEHARRALGSHSSTTPSALVSSPASPLPPTEPARSGWKTWIALSIFIVIVPVILYIITSGGEPTGEQPDGLTSSSTPPVTDVTATESRTVQALPSLPGEWWGAGDPSVIDGESSGVVYQSFSDIVPSHGAAGPVLVSVSLAQSKDNGATWSRIEPTS